MRMILFLALVAGFLACAAALALTACQRYLQEYDSYQHEHSSELTPKGVITERLERLDNRARLRDELQPGDHVWVDVGDGDPLSDVKSRMLAPCGTFEILAIQPRLDLVGDLSLFTTTCSPIASRLPSSEAVERV